MHSACAHVPLGVTMSFGPKASSKKTSRPVPQGARTSLGAYHQRYQRRSLLCRAVQQVRDGVDSTGKLDAACCILFLTPSATFENVGGLPRRTLNTHTSYSDRGAESIQNQSPR